MRLLLGMLSFGLAFVINSISSPALAQGGDQFVLLQTTKGPITMRIFYSMVPNTAGNFLDLVDQGFYNGLTWHRVENWVIQGGDPNGNGSGHYMDPNTGQPKFLRLEINRNLGHNQAGMVAMARSADPNSASCQFYILKSPMPQLNGKYAVFGRVTNGMQTVYNIRPGDRILSATILQPQSGAAPAQSSSEAPAGEPARPTKPAESGF
jgi:peptidyl-prolyl cis-trans isomerase B (cyclophilin B)